MTENVLLQTYEELSTGREAPVRNHDAVHTAIRRLAEGEELSSLDPQLISALQALVKRLDGVWGKKGSFLEVGMSPFLQNLFVKANSEWASA